MARFLIDAQLPPALAKALQDAGQKAEHVEDVGLREAEDKVIWARVCANNGVLVTKDEDFVERYRRHTDEGCLLWLRIGNSSTRTLLAWFMPLLPQLLARLEAGDKFIEVR
jgi:predicted nuclease of predicted toxin-antitoxin system